MTRDEMLTVLSELYTRTGMDWHLKVDHCLTEPTCPTAVVVPEYFQDLSLFRCDADTIEQAVDGALARAVLWMRGKDQPESVFTGNFMDEEILALCLRVGEQSRAKWAKRNVTPEAREGED